MLQRGLTLAKANDKKNLTALITSLEIPNAHEWFIKTYGPGKGEDLAAEYRRDLAKHEALFRERLSQLSPTGLVRAEKVTDPSRFGFETLTPIAHLYHASWKMANAPPESKSGPIGYFIFLEGAFRWYSLVEFPQHMQRATFAKKVAPKYPAEAKDRGLYGAVELQITIGKDGAVEVQKVLSGHPILAKAAVEAVAKWKYHPLLVDGKPMPVQTTITVNFDR